MPAPAHVHLLPSAFQEGRGLRPEWAGVELLFASVLGAGVPGASVGAGAGQGAGHRTLSLTRPLRIPAPPGSPSPETFQDSFPSHGRAALHPSQGPNPPVPAAYLDQGGSGRAWRGCGSALGFIGP